MARPARIRRAPSRTALAPPPRVKSALLLIDVINPLDFDGAGVLIPSAEAAAERMEGLRRAAAGADAPVIYVNDNYGEWSEDFRALVERMSAPHAPGRRVVERLRPEPGHLHVLKPMHSGFFATPLEQLLRRLEVERLVLCGIQTHMCVLFTAHDAHMRGYDLVVPDDASATERPEQHDAALVVLRSLGAHIAPAETVRFA